MIGLVTGLAMLAAFGGPLGVLFFPNAVQTGIGIFINLKEGGMVYPLYMNPPFPSEASYYIYAVKNPKETLQGAKMNLDLKGPYYYDAYLNRDNIVFSADGERVRFDTHRKMYLNENKSANLDERFWILNPIIPGTLKTVKTLVLDRIPFQRVTEPIVFNTVNVLLDNFKERLIQKKSPRELLEGRKVELLESVEALAGRFGLKSLVPPGPPENTFGVAHFQNNTVDQIEVYTGIGKTKDKFGDVYKWRNKEKLTFWSGKCNEIGGTNGELYKPNVPQGKPLKIFLSQLCRTFYLNPVQAEPVTVQDGLQALEFELTPRLYSGAQSYPKNKCFCTDTKSYDCQYDGFISMAPCFFDAPLFFARTNMKGVDRRIRSLINEDSFKHHLPDKQSFYLEPNTGSILKVNLTLLSTFKVVKQRYMRDLANVQNLTYAPLFLASETVQVPLPISMPLLGLQMMLAYYKPFYILLAIGGILVLLIKFATRGKKPPPPAILPVASTPAQPLPLPTPIPAQIPGKPLNDEREVEGS